MKLELKTSESNLLRKFNKVGKIKESTLYKRDVHKTSLRLLKKGLIAKSRKEHTHTPERFEITAEGRAHLKRETRKQRQ